MSAPKFTPGPWWFGISCSDEVRPIPLDYESPGYFNNPAIYGADGYEVVGCDEYHVFSTPANTALMLAAPELYEALDALSLVVGLTAFKHEGQRAPLQESVDAARAALAKARGESNG